MFVSYLAYSSTLNMGATCSSETSVDFNRTTCRYIPKDRILRFWLNFNHLLRQWIQITRCYRQACVKMYLQCSRTDYFNYTIDVLSWKHRSTKRHFLSCFPLIRRYFRAYFNFLKKERKKHTHEITMLPLCV
jgi:hypothetical protein